MKVALVTGAAGGIGTALCAAFRAAGHHVVGTDMAATGPGDTYVRCDLDRLAADAGYRATAIQALRGALPGGRLDALVNNAAVQRLAETQQLKAEDWDATLRVNLTAPFFLAQAFVDELAAAQGSIVNIASIHATLTKPGFVAYATSKAALVGLTRALAVDLRGRVRVNAICPAAIDTPMLREGFVGNRDGFQALASAHPSNRIGLPSEVAHLAVQASQGPGFLNGAVIELDGAVGSRLHDPA